MGFIKASVFSLAFISFAHMVGCKPRSMNDSSAESLVPVEALEASAAAYQNVMNEIRSATTGCISTARAAAIAPSIRVRAKEQKTDLICAEADGRLAQFWYEWDQGRMGGIWRAWASSTDAPSRIDREQHLVYFANHCSSNSFFEIGTNADRRLELFTLVFTREGYCRLVSFWETEPALSGDPKWSGEFELSDLDRNLWALEFLRDGIGPLRLAVRLRESESRSPGAFVPRVSVSEVLPARLNGRRAAKSFVFERSSDLRWNRK